MKDTGGVHTAPREQRVARGVRMAESLWSFVDDLADIMTDGNASALIEKWAREKRDAVRSAG